MGKANKKPDFSFSKTIQEMSMVIVKKRERTQNWALEEKNVLLSLIKPQINAIENKKIDAAASAMKSQAWRQIHDSFKGRFSTDRDMTRIKEQWRRMKAQSKSEMITFAERVRIDPEEASKYRPTGLSLDIWRLLENAKRADGEEMSDECKDDSSGILQLLESCAVLPKSESESQENSQEPFDNNDGNENMNINQNHKRTLEPIDEKGESPKKKKRVDKHGGSGHFVRDNAPLETQIHEFEEERASEASQEYQKDEEDYIPGNVFLMEAAHKEHKLKVYMLELDIQRAELQKQAAFNELKTSEVKRELIESQANEYYNQVRMAGERGSGAGKGGGGGGAIRDAGGSFGKMESAHEDQYFYNLQKEQLKKLKCDLKDEITFHEEQIKRHEEAINRHKKNINEMEKQS